MNFTGLEEFSNYTVAVNATFNLVDAFDGPGHQTLEVTTLSAPPTAVPSNLTLSHNSTSIHLTWDSIECSRRNGPILGYAVMLQKQGGAITHREDVTISQYFTSGLVPYTNYTVLVAGINPNGTGPFYMRNLQTNASSESKKGWPHFRESE